MADLFANFQTGLSSPAIHLDEVVPNDTADLERYSRGLNVAEGGYVHVTTIEGDEGRIFLAPGSIFPIRVRKVWATGTTAIGIVSLC